MSEYPTRTSPPYPTSESSLSSLLIAFSIAQFLDILNISALFSAISVISKQLSLNPSEAVWLLSASQLTFASFLLLVSLLYNDANRARKLIGFMNRTVDSATYAIRVSTTSRSQMLALTQASLEYLFNIGLGG